MASVWVAVDEQGLAGNLGLEPVEIGRELRRMYVNARCRRKGLGRLMLAHAEPVAGRQGSARIVLSPPSFSRPRSCSTVPPAISWSGKRSPPPSPTEPSGAACDASTSKRHSPVSQTGPQVGSIHMQPPSLRFELQERRPGQQGCAMDPAPPEVGCNWHAETGAAEACLTLSFGSRPAAMTCCSMG
jgi:hypothetical protein